MKNKIETALEVELLRNVDFPYDPISVPALDNTLPAQKILKWYNIPLFPEDSNLYWVLEESTIGQKYSSHEDIDFEKIKQKIKQIRWSVYLPKSVAKTNPVDLKKQLIKELL